MVAERLTEEDLVLARNLRDFERVPSLTVEWPDW